LLLSGYLIVPVSAIEPADTPEDAVIVSGVRFGHFVLGRTSENEVESIRGKKALGIDFQFTRDHVGAGLSSHFHNGDKIADFLALPADDVLLARTGVQAIRHRKSKAVSQSDAASDSVMNELDNEPRNFREKWLLRIVDWGTILLVAFRLWETVKA
jgi:hypothetical protein